MGTAEALFGAAKAAGLTRPTIDGCDDQHAQGDTLGDTNIHLGGGAD
jgi:hypothetical protein